MKRFLSTTASLFARELRACKSKSELESLVSRHSDALRGSSADCASAINLLGRLKTDKTCNAVQQVMQIATQPELKYTPQEIAQVCTGIAMGRFAEKMPENIVSQLKQQKLLDAMDARQLVWTLGSFSLLQDKARWYCELVRDQILRRNLSTFTGPDFALIMHYFDEFDFMQEGGGGAQVLECFAKEIASRSSLSDFKPGHFALLLDSFSRESADNERSTPLHIRALCQRISQDICFDRRAENLLAEFEPRDFALVLNAFAEFNIRDRVLCDNIAREILHRSNNKENGLKDFDTQYIGKILGSLEHLDFVNADLVEALLSEVMRREELEEEEKQLQSEMDEDEEEDNADEQARRLAKAMRASKQGRSDVE